MRPRRFPLAVLAALALPPLPASAQQQNQGVQAQQSPWTSRCTADSRDGEPECVVEVRVSLPSGQLVAGLTVRIPAETRSPVMMVQVPLGLYLPAGITLTVDTTDPVPMPLQTCDASGCFAGGPLNADLLASLKDGGTLKLAFQNLGRNPITVPIALSGFTAAYEKVE